MSAKGTQSGLLCPAVLSQSCRSRHRESAVCSRDICYLFCVKTALYGRIVFGASAVLFGVIALMWRDPDTWQNLQEIWRLPFGALIGGCLMTAQIARAIGMQYPRTARLASVVLGVVYLFFSLACIPGIITASTIYERYGESFFLFFSLLCGAIALYAATEANAARAVVFGRLARLGLGLQMNSLLDDVQRKRAVRSTMFRLQPAQHWRDQSSAPGQRTKRWGYATSAIIFRRLKRGCGKERRSTSPSANGLSRVWSR